MHEIPARGRPLLPSLLSLLVRTASSSPRSRADLIGAEPLWSAVNSPVDICHHQRVEEDATVSMEAHTSRAVLATMLRARSHYLGFRVFGDLRTVQL